MTAPRRHLALATWTGLRVLSMNLGNISCQGAFDDRKATTVSVVQACTLWWVELTGVDPGGDQTVKLKIFPLQIFPTRAQGKSDAPRVRRGPVRAGAAPSTGWPAPLSSELRRNSVAPRAEHALCRHLSLFSVYGSLSLFFLNDPNTCSTLVIDFKSLVASTLLTYTLQFQF